MQNPTLLRHCRKIFRLLPLIVIPGFAQIGININLAERGGTFIDLVRESYRWNINGTAITSANVDAQGWPTADADFIYDARPVAEWAGQIDDPEKYRIDMSGTYKCAFTGRATLSASGGRIVNQTYVDSDNRTTFDLVIDGPPGPGHGFLILKFSNTVRTPGAQAGSGIRNLKIHRPGYPLDHPDVFAAPFIQALLGINFEAIRFMPFSGANDVDPVYPKVTHWNQRKTLADASQARMEPLDKLDGASWELVIALGNRLHKDIWINVPVSATEDYIRQLAALIRDGLEPALNVYVESGNEVWNNIFPQHAYNLAQAAALGIGEHENHARRTAQLADLFGQAFGPGSLNTRVRAILCSHAPMLKWWVEPMLTYLDKNRGKPSGYLYGISSQAYFSIAPDAGLSIPEILSRARANILGQIDESGGVNQASRLQWVQKAAQWNLPGGYFIYEGGSHPILGSQANLGNTIMAERDPEMGVLLKLNYTEGFTDVGGKLAMHFLLSSAYTRYGCFGLTDDIGKPERNSKYAAMRDLAGGSTTVLPPGSRASDTRNHNLYRNSRKPEVRIRNGAAHRVYQSDWYDLKGAFLEREAMPE